jgi:hypothetical protein
MELLEKRELMAVARSPEGWSVVTPSDDTRILFVSSTEGDDDLARAYAPTDVAVGADPFHPAGPVHAFKTVAAAITASRAGQPDWILLRRGDAWYERLRTPSGRSEQEPFLVSAYGDAPQRPQIKHGDQSGVVFGDNWGGGGKFRNIALIGVDFYAHTRDPESPEYVPGTGGNPSGVLLALHGSGVNENLLIEDCAFRFNTTGLRFEDRQSNGSLHNIVLRRNLFLDNYSARGQGHSQGLFAYDVPLVIEENIFDHNGWNESPAVDAGATIFNHNIYLSHVHDTVVRGNVFLRASSIGAKFRADEVGTGRNIVVDDNLFVEGEVGISLGGNVNEPNRFSNVTLTNNVMTDIGRSRPTNRTVAWYIDTKDWDGGVIANNLMMHQDHPEVRNTLALILSNSMRNVRVENNIVHGLKSAKPMVWLKDADRHEGVTVNGNWVDSSPNTSALLQASANLDGYTFGANSYLRAGDQSWFSVAGTTMDLARWRTLTGDEATSIAGQEFPDPGRTLESYNQMLGGTASLAGLIVELRQQSRATWRPEYGAKAINAYMRGGFNRGPEVDAGPDQSVTSPEVALLVGQSSDDGRFGSQLTTEWSLVSGPGTVTFEDATALNTAVTFSAPGEYVLRLTASDGMLSSVEELTIVVNRTPTLNISDVTVMEGHAGTRSATFTVTLSAASNQLVTVNYATADGTAVSPSDYTAASGTLTFAPGETTKTITVLVKGDRLGEADEAFFLNLSAASNATVADAQGLGTIVDDEPRFRINNVSMMEGNSGTRLYVFTVTLSAAYDQAVWVAFRTLNGSATAGDNDYVANAGSLNFNAGVTTRTVAVQVRGDIKQEADETFYLDLFRNSSNSLVANSRGIATILNDD